MVILAEVADNGSWTTSNASVSAFLSSAVNLSYGVHSPRPLGSRYWSSTAVSASKAPAICGTRVGSIWSSAGFRVAKACRDPSTLAWKSSRSIREYASSSPVIFDASTSSSSVADPLAISNAW